MSTPIRIGAIDAGSNALRVVVGEVGPRGLVYLEAERVAVRLGTGAFTRGALSPAVINDAVAAFAGFRAMFDRHGVTAYRAVATSAVRDAENRDVLLHRLFHEAHIELDVIDGEEEARLVRKATLHAFGRARRAGDATPDVDAILDLGGGSLEVNLRRDERWRGYSMPVGTVRLLETFGLAGALGGTEVAIVQRYVASLMQSILPTSRGPIRIAAVTGGNAEAWAKLCGEAARGPDGAGGSGDAIIGAFAVADLEAALPAVLRATVEERMQRYGVRRDRAEVMGVAGVIFATAGRQLGIERMLVPGVGIRDALMLDLAETARQRDDRDAGATDKALLTAARSFIHRIDHDGAHAEHVRRLARTLFMALRDVHGLPDRQLVTLELAALLHDVGEVVNPKGHHKHSEYLIRHARIPGLDDDQRAMIAALARAHRKGGHEAVRVIADAPLAKEQRAVARRLAALLRIADSLDQEHRQRVVGVLVGRDGDDVVLDLQLLPELPGQPAGADEATLLRKADLFASEFGIPVRGRITRVAARHTGSFAVPALPDAGVGASVA